MDEMISRKEEILVVDDTPSGIRMVKNALEDSGYRVSAATSGKRAIRTALLTKPDLILLDILMPEMDGYETCALLKAEEKTRHIPVIFMSALTETFDKVKGFNLGAVDYITKPIRIEELLARVNTHLTTSRLQKELKEMNRTLEEKVAARTREHSSTNEALKREIRERSQAEAALRESEEKFSKVFSSNPAAMAITALETQRVVDINDSLTQSTGYTKEEVMGRTTLELGFWVNPATFDITTGTLEKHGSFRDLEFEFRNKSGENRLGIFCSEVIHINGEAFVATAMKDITEQKSAEEKLKKLNEELEMRVLLRTAQLESANRKLREAKATAESATRAKSMFLANMSHEIRTPLNAILGFIDLSLKTDLAWEQRDYLTRIRRASRSLFELIHDILDFSKIEAEKVDIENRDFCLEEILEDMANLFTAQAGEKGVKLIIGIDPGIKTRLVGDAVRIRQVLINLVGNAVKFTREGKIKVHVSLTEETNEAVLLKFSVRDTGPGIPRENLTHIFDAFSRIEGFTTKQYAGTGLGLSICKKLVELMEGEIRAKSEPGRGSTFLFQIPLGKKDPGPHPAHPDSRIIAGVTALLVSGTPDAMEEFARMTEALGIRITWSDPGKPSVGLIREKEEEGKRFRLLFLDKSSGTAEDSAITGEAARNARIPVVLLTEDPAPWPGHGIDARLSPSEAPSTLYYTFLTVLRRTPGEKENPAGGNREENDDSVRMPTGIRVLLAEDNELNREVALKLLSGLGIVSHMVENGREAVAAACQNRYDAVLMDIQMPEMDGFTAAGKIRDLGLDLPVIAMTALDPVVHRRRILSSGICDFIPKPIAPDRLLAVLEKWTGKQGNIGMQQERDIGAEFPELPGIDVPSALGRLKGDAPLFNRILKDFAVKWADAGLRINRAMGKGDMKELRSLAHSLKGVAGNLSAKGLQTAAGKLEALIPEKGSGDPKEMGDAVIKLENELDRVLKSAAQPETSAEGPMDLPAPAENGDSPDMSHTRSLLMELKECLSARRTDADLLMKSVAVHLAHHGLSREKALLEKQITEFDFKGAGSTVNTTAEKIGISLE